MSKLELIITLQKEYKYTAEKYEAILANNTDYDLKWESAKQKYPRQEDENAFYYYARIDKLVLEITGLSKESTFGFKAKLKRLRIQITQLMLEWERAVSESNSKM